MRQLCTPHWIRPGLKASIFVLVLQGDKSPCSLRDDCLQLSFSRRDDCLQLSFCLRNDCLQLSFSLRSDFLRLWSQGVCGAGPGSLRN